MEPRIATAMLGSGRISRRVRVEREPVAPGFVAWLARRLGLASLGAARRT
jgi:hypothetical protein